MMGSISDIQISVEKSHVVPLIKLELRLVENFYFLLVYFLSATYIR